MRWISSLLRAPVDFALPLRCAGCGDIRENGGDFCLSCWSRLQWLGTNGCLRCLMPMDREGLVCAPCLATPPTHDGVLAAVAYGEIARTLVLRLKYGRKPGMARVMAALMERHARLSPDAILVPVPLHRWRLWSRGFNQSQLIAHSISRKTAQAVFSQLLVRKRKTRALGGLGRTKRHAEVAGAFALRANAVDQIHGRDILLVDDVYTTGATANACAAVLKRGGARSVRVLCWARVLQDVG